MNKMIISVLGQDRPGIIAAVTKVLFEQDFNIEDVSQTILQQQFSGIFIAVGPDGVTRRVIGAALEKATTDFDLHFTIRRLADEPSCWTNCPCDPYVITTRGPDRKGLVSLITATLGAHNVNVTQLQAVFRGGNEPGRNIMIYEVDIPSDTDQKEVRRALQARADELDLQISIQHKKIFEAINRI